MRILLAALLCVLTFRGAMAADAGSENANSNEEISRKSLRHRHFLVDPGPQEITHPNTARPIPPGLQRVMAEGAGRVVNPSCADVRAVVAWIGEAKAEAAARSAGATDGQIAVARQCLTKKVKK